MLKISRIFSSKRTINRRKILVAVNYVADRSESSRVLILYFLCGQKNVLVFKFHRELSFLTFWAKLTWIGIKDGKKDAKYKNSYHILMDLCYKGRAASALVNKLLSQWYDDLDLEVWTCCRCQFWEKFDKWLLRNLSKNFLNIICSRDRCTTRLNMKAFEMVKQAMIAKSH